MLKADGLDSAIIGVGSRCGQKDLLIYDIDKVIWILMQRDGMTDEEAVEFFEFNIQGSWQGEETPIWMRPYDIDEIEGDG
jgi:hypothetical protein|tara:strand:+ start:769 stop:1008 length:240 start_codon:yes stop_codon:yes gene_type:complete